LHSHLGTPGDVGAALPGFLKSHRALWQNRASDFLANSASSSAEYLRAIDAAGFTYWSVSYNKWTSGPERTSAATATRWRDGSEVTEQHADLRHPVGDFTFPLACARWKKEGEMFWRYAFVAHEERRTDAAAVMARHRLKGATEQLFKDVLRGLDLHHPPCESLTANRMFYAIVALAYNLIKAVQILCLPDECQGWTVPTPVKQIMRLPALLARHARVLVARVAVAASWLDWWQKWQARWWAAQESSASGALSGRRPAQEQSLRITGSSSVARDFASGPQNTIWKPSFCPPKRLTRCF